MSRRLAARFVHAGAPPCKGREAARDLPRSVSAGALVLVAAIPLLFLHADYQPSVSISLAGTTVTAYLSDFAVLAVVLAAAAVAVQRAGALRDGRPLWLAGGLFFLWVGFEVLYGRMHASGYAAASHGVTALKFFEYALLAPAVALLVRRRDDLLAVLWALTLWSAAATAVAVAQFFGASIALANLVGQREASFVGYSDFAALSVATLLVGVVGIALPRLGLQRVGAAAATTGALGTILAGAIAGALGAVTASVVLALVLWLRAEIVPRRLVVVGAIVLAVVLGTVEIRNSDLQTFARFVGSSTSGHPARAADVQTYSQRTVLVWIGYEIWKDHPLLGVGWQGSDEPVNFVPYLPAAHRRFPSVADIAFPAEEPGRHYGVQNVWVQALADLGVVGLILWLATFVAAAWLALRGALRRFTTPHALALAVTAALFWLWAAQGFIAGVPLDALTFIAFGLAVSRVADA